VTRGRELPVKTGCRRSGDKRLRREVVNLVRLRGAMALMSEF
jgi:hypothetical protein